MSVHATGLLNVAAAALPWGRYEETRGLLHAAAALIPDAEHHRVAEGSRLIEATLDWHTGAWEGLAPAMCRLADAETTEVHDALVARLLAGLVRGATAPGPGDETELRAVARQLDALGIAEPVTLLPCAFLGRRALQDGDAQRALDITAPAAEAVAAKGVWLWFADVAPVHAEALARSGRRADAEALVAAFTRAVEPSLAPVAAGAVDLCGAVLAEHDEDFAGAAELYRAAAAVWAGIPRPYDELLALEGVGRCLLADGRRGDGLGVLRDVRTRLTVLGATRDGDRIARVLREQGEDVVRTWRRGRRGYGDALSPREREVLALVARGLTNREAAEALFLSPRTVGRHLESAMRKLHVTTRTAAAMTAVESGLLAAESDSASDGTAH